MKTNLKITPVCSWLQGAKRPLIISGPCSAESEEQMLATARGIAAIDKKIIFRAGVWKPRTRPGAFEGMGQRALEWMQKVKSETGLSCATEVANASHVEECLRYGIDILWIGARTTVNPFSVQEIADALRGTNIPVLVKNPVNPELQLWLGALERLDRAGINKLVAVHRGFHSNEPSPFRNIPRWEMAIELRLLCSELPLICDPSHICGNTELIPYIAQKALDLDMHGLMIETHCMPASAKSDARQQVTPAQLSEMLQRLVLRKEKVKDRLRVSELEGLRKNVDAADDELMQVLLKRMCAVERIGEFKRANKVTILQRDRWEEVMKERANTALLMGLDVNFVKRLYELLHAEAIRRQEEIMNEVSGVGI